MPTGLTIFLVEPRETVWRVYLSFAHMRRSVACDVVIFRQSYLVWSMNDVVKDLWWGT